jgi:type III secretion protein L
LEDLEQVDVAVDAARTEAERILEDARRNAEETLDEARRQGRSEGCQELLAELAKARRVYAQALDEAESDMLEMAFRLAGRIIGEAVEREPRRIESMVSSVLRRARGKRDIVVMVAPDDLPMLEGAGSELARQVDGVAVHFEADASLTRGGCVIQTESGRIDGRIETQLDALRRALQGG